MNNRSFEPNFQSDAYKEQAKEIYKRRMHYNPREAASKSIRGGVSPDKQSTVKSIDLRNVQSQKQS